MKKYLFTFGILLLAACATVPVTGRKKFNIIPVSQIMPMALQQYKQTLSESKTLGANAKYTQEVRSVGARMEKAVTEYLTENNAADLVQGYNWEFNVIESPEMNAWCMPGGKIAFYSGIMPICQDDTGVAVVMGHEIAHAIANHGGERMQTQMAVQLGGIGLGVAMQNQPALTQQLALQAFGIGSTLGVLKYSRLHESEADRMGLMFMAKAGYDPRQAVTFWGRMQKAASESGSQRPPEFLSTHPSEDRRIADLKKYMPDAIKLYEQTIAAKETK